VVKAAVKRQGRFELRLAGGRRVRTKKLLLATGIRDNCPDIPGFRRFVGRGVYYCSYCDGYTVRDRPLAALGRGVDGAELALALTTWSRDVLFCTNGIARPSSKVCAQLERYGVGVRGGDRIVRVEGRTHLEWLVFKRGQRVGRPRPASRA
jgi:thioredoxin reductase